MALRIPLLDLKPQLRELGPQLERRVQEVLRSGQFILGPHVAAFEEECADYLGVRHAVGLNSGTDGLTIALRALEIGPGDEVITSSFTFFATAEVIRGVGAVPVFADIQPESFCLDPAAVRSKIGPRTRAILPVHIFGHAADMEALLALAEEHGLAVIEDNAQGFGGTYRGRKLGSLGTAAAFSFFPSKNLAAFGDAGLLATNDERLAELARALRQHGAIERDVHIRLGYNSRLDELQAALLRVKLPHIDRWAEARRHVAKEYTQRLSAIRGIVPPATAPHVGHAYNLYTIRVLEGRRDVVKKALDDAGIGNGAYYAKPLHKMPLYASQAACLPATDQASAEVLSLPIWPELDVESIHEITTCIAAAL